MIRTTLRILALAAMLGAALTVTSYAATSKASSAKASGPIYPKVGGAAMLPTRNIIENALNSRDHTTLVAAVKAAGLVGTLEGPGPFTVLAPTNEAFAALPAGTVANLLKPENKATLVKILECHVIPAKAMAADIMAMVKADGGTHVVDTLGGCKLSLKMAGNKVTVTDENGNGADVTIADVVQSNGVIDVIDKVLLPKM